MAKGGKRVLVPRPWEELSIETTLVEKAFGRPVSDQEFAALEGIKRRLETAFNNQTHAPLMSTVEKERKRLDSALETIERVFLDCELELGLCSALARSMCLPEDHRTDDANDSLSALRKLAANLRERIKVGSLDALIATTSMEPRTFCFRVLLYEIAPLATKWGITISERSPRFVDLIHAFGLFNVREKTINAIKNNKKKVDINGG